jgi:peroxiredoxin Q/BCP
MEELTVGQKAPQFILPSSMGGRVSLKDFRTKSHVVLFFYEKDMTSRCITEACGFRDLHYQFENAGAAIVGVGTDEMESHRKFADVYRLNFPLLYDAGASVSTRYGVHVEKGRYGHTFMGIERTTFIIDKAGGLRKIYKNINVDKHAKQVLEFVQGLS